MTSSSSHDGPASTRRPSPRPQRGRRKSLAPPACLPPTDPPGLASRGLALILLRAVLRRHRTLDEAMAEGGRDWDRLAPRDRAFVHHLVAACLRRLGQIDSLIARCLDRPLPEDKRETRDILRLGATQLLFMRVPAHAAVDASVTLAARGPAQPHKGLINAVLRRLAREGEAWAAAQDAARLNTPAWLWESWVAAYGEAATRAIAAGNLREPPLDLSFKQDDPGTWLPRFQEAGYADAHRVGTASLRLPRIPERIDALPGYQEGAWWVQDAGAALAARLLAPKPGERILDLCAAPGGKTAQLCAAGAEVIALDRSGPRLKRLRENLDRLALQATLVEADGTAWRSDTPVDAVLLDAPCTSTGTICRHPDILHHKRPEDVHMLASLQERLLHTAQAVLKPGGRLVFATCSLQPEEGERQEAALAPRLPETTLRLLPDSQGSAEPEAGLEGAQVCDGFYMARWRD